MKTVNKGRKKENKGWKKKEVGKEERRDKRGNEKRMKPGRKAWKKEEIEVKGGVNEKRKSKEWKKW